MSNHIPTDVLLDHAGSDYDDLPDDVKQMVDDAETDLAGVGIDVKADFAATEDADEAPASVTAPARDKTVTSFTSRGKARSYATDNNLRVIDNGASADTRWTVGPKASGAITKPRKARKARTAPATAVTKPGAKKAVDKKTVALEVYSSLEAKGTLKRSNFLTEMETRTGLSSKGASSYFYRIKGGKW